jgi:lyso-ornithine lipid O-acyltransferase
MIAWTRIGLAVLFVAAVTLVLLPFQLFFIAFKLKGARRLPRLWHRAALFAIGVRVVTRGKPVPGRPLMIAANHVSWLDILVLGATLDLVFVAKAEVRDWPVFGPLARLQRSIFIVRENRREAGDQADEMADRLNAGEVVVLFPEGTTSDGNRLYDIKSSLFAAATNAARSAREGLVHVQPVSIAYTHLHGLPMGHYHRPVVAWPGDVPLMPHLIGVLKAGAIDVEVGFGAVFDVTPQSNRKVVSAHVRSEIQRLLELSLRHR